MKRRRKLILLSSATGILLWPGFVTWRILDSACVRSITGNADVAVVLGASAPHGVPSPVFAARIDYAIDLLRAGHVKAILFTGGRGPHDILADSQAAETYALSKSVSAQSILKETRSRTTR